MYRIIDKRATGKTSRLMLLAKEKNIPIACMHPHVMSAKALAYGLTGINFISYSDLLDDHSRGRKDEDVLVDELEVFVQYAIKNYHLKGYTLSDED